jgi:small GTP-binding protein
LNAVGFIFSKIERISTSMLKVVTVGESGVGKTSIINKFLNSSTAEVFPTVGAFSLQCPVQISPGREIVLNVWDTAGQEQFRAMIPLYLRNARACFYVFDCANPPTVEVLNATIVDLKGFLEPDTLLFLCGNKVDLPHELEPIRLFEAWAREKKIHFCQTSAVSGEGVVALFQAVARMLADVTMPLEVEEGAERPIESGSDKKCC